MRSRPLDAVARYGAAAGAVVFTTLLIGGILILAPIGNLAILYLVPVLASATRLGRGPALFASLAAFFLYDWFFVQPLSQVTIADPAEWVALLLFLVTAFITSELAANERTRALVAERREREATLLYEALRLMGEPDLDAALRAVAERVRAELAVPAVAVELTAGGRTHAVTVGDAAAIALDTEVLGAGRTGGQPGRWIRVVPPPTPGKTLRIRGATRRYEVPIRSNAQPVGAIALIRDARHAAFAPHESRLLALLATQLGALAGRAELQEAITQGEILRRTDDLKSALLSAVSHDLRTPLASIMASAGSLRQRDVHWTDAERDEFLETIEQQAERLSRIVGNLLDLSRIEAGALRPKKELHDLRALIDDVVGRLAPLTEDRAVAIDVGDSVPPVPMDEVQIDQVLSNLIENAVKYSPRSTEIGIRARPEDGFVRIDVTDRGPGIPPAEIEGLFTPFRRSPAVRGIAGFGVGLAVARGLVEAHGGTITGGNRPEGGARFSFTLPLEPMDTAPRVVAR